ncbi:MAG TPA: hypothetical protein VM619_02540 [Luteimonas sp.]|nr:hypothetical protein [Luteimonas sp.]
MNELLGTLQADQQLREQSADAIEGPRYDRVDNKNVEDHEERLGAISLEDAKHLGEANKDVPNGEDGSASEDAGNSGHCLDAKNNRNNRGNGVANIAE